VVLEAAGSTEALARAIELVAPGGTVVSVGAYQDKVEVDWLTLFPREARLAPSLGYCTDDGRRKIDDVAWAGSSPLPTEG
jgi:threonine dehydrogenase-like Zn-dependent dehydrogenase